MTVSIPWRQFLDEGGSSHSRPCVFPYRTALQRIPRIPIIVTDGDVEIRYVVPTSPDGERGPFWRLRTDYRDRDRPVQAGHRRRVAISDRCPAGHRNRPRHPCPKPHARARTPELRLHRVTRACARNFATFFRLRATRPPGPLVATPAGAPRGGARPFPATCLGVLSWLEEGVVRDRNAPGFRSVPIRPWEDQTGLHATSVGADHAAAGA